MTRDELVIQALPSFSDNQLKMSFHFFVLREEGRLGEIPEAIEDKLFQSVTVENLSAIMRRAPLVSSWDELVAGL